VRLTDNEIIEKALGKHGIICIEDLIHEITTVGSHFKEASNFLWPFKLNNPNGGWRSKTNHFIDVRSIFRSPFVMYIYAVHNRVVTLATVSASSTPLWRR
jgi:hypothetical protein